MPIKSMTGFGAASARVEGICVSIELNSVNRKQLDVVLRLPSVLAAYESRIQKAVQQYISRGRISGTVQIDAESGASAVKVNDKRAKAIVEKMRKTARQLKLEDDLKASLLLQIPGLLKVQNGEQSSEETFQCLEKALTAALKKLNAMRVREGKALAADLQERLALLETALEKIKTRAPQIVSNHRKKLFQTLESAFAEASADKNSGVRNFAQDERIIKEVALFGERSDISEEIIRLKSHIQQFKKLLRGKEPAGRTLDFLSQELLREINTIGSKANDLNITEQVVQFKTELERIREQVQNVE